jgi:hypothetical protein
VTETTLSGSTLKLDVEGDGGDGEDLVAPETGAWWLGFRDRLIAPRHPRTPEPANQRSANRAGLSTIDVSHTRDLSGLNPIPRRRPWFGRRGFLPVYQWEGVVEEVNGTSFRARLRPFEEGPTEGARVEYADFDYDDLADESDHGLVAEGAVFYWTIGKSRNVAGTLFNTSLVRFRRLPSPTAAQKRQAAREAAALLADLEESQ